MCGEPVMLRQFLIALQFLTVLPVRFRATPDNEAVGRSLLYYPLVGLLLGGLLTATAWALDETSAPIAAAAIVTLWVLATGALHLDGLADSADAWIGGLGDRQRTLAIMKDPYCGPAAVSALVLALLLKFTTLAHLVTIGRLDLLALAPVLGRTALVLLFLTTPYVRTRGIGSPLAEALSRRACVGVVLFVPAAVLVLIGTAAFWPLIAATGAFLALRALMMRRIGGTTGDTAGALVEIIETIALLTAALRA